MPASSCVARAAALVARTHNFEEPLVVDQAEALDPVAGRPVYLFKVVRSGNANGPAHTVILDERGEEVEATRNLESLFSRTVLTAAGTPGPVAAPVTIQPDTNVLTLNPGDTVDETITVTIPKNAGAAKADV